MHFRGLQFLRSCLRGIDNTTSFFILLRQIMVTETHQHPHKCQKPYNHASFTTMIMNVHRGNTISMCCGKRLKESRSHGHPATVRYRGFLERTYSSHRKSACVQQSNFSCPRISEEPRQRLIHTAVMSVTLL